MTKTGNMIIDAMIARGMPLTVRAYISWYWMGDKTLQEGEKLVEVLIDRKRLVSRYRVKSNQLNIETCLTPECPNWIRRPKPPSLYFISDKTQHAQIAVSVPSEPAENPLYPR